MGRRLLPRLQDFLFVLLMIGGLSTGSRMLNIDSDLGRHLTVGGFILSSHQIPTHDILSFTKTGASRPAYEWLAQLLLAGANKILGLDGVVLLTSIVIAAAFSWAYLDSVERSGAPLISLLIVSWAAIASSLHWLPRPHVFSFLFFAAWLSWLERLRRGRHVPIWLFAASMMLWSNTHGGFVFGFLALGAYLAGWLWEYSRGRADRQLGSQLLAVTVVSAIASLVTPDLWHNWEAVLNNRSAYVLSRTVETMPLQITTPGVWPFLAMLGATVLLALARRLRSPASHMFLLLGLAATSMAMVRNIPLFAIAAAPILSEWAASVFGRFEAWKHIEGQIQELETGLLRYIWCGLSVLAAVTFLSYREAAQRPALFAFRADVFPVQAADWLLAHPERGKMFNEFNWGGYLLYRLWPEQKVFIDSQSDFYGESLTREAASIEEGEPGWESALSGFEIDRIVVPRTAGLVPAALASHHWALAYEDAIAAILVRTQ